MSTQSKVAQTFLSVPKDCRILGTDRKHHERTYQ